MSPRAPTSWETIDTSHRWTSFSSSDHLHRDQRIGLRREPAADMNINIINQHNNNFGVDHHQSRHTQQRKPREANQVLQTCRHSPPTSKTVNDNVYDKNLKGRTIGVGHHLPSHQQVPQFLRGKLFLREPSHIRASSPATTAHLHVTPTSSTTLYCNDYTTNTIKEVPAAVPVEKWNCKSTCGGGITMHASLDVIYEESGTIIKGEDSNMEGDDYTTTDDSSSFTSDPFDNSSTDDSSSFTSDPFDNSSSVKSDVDYVNSYNGTLSDVDSETIIEGYKDLIEEEDYDNSSYSFPSTSSTTDFLDDSSSTYSCSDLEDDDHSADHNALLEEYNCVRNSILSRGCIQAICDEVYSNTVTNGPIVQVLSSRSNFFDCDVTVLTVTDGVHQISADIPTSAILNANWEYAIIQLDSYELHRTTFRRNISLSIDAVTYLTHTGTPPTEICDTLDINWLQQWSDICQLAMGTPFEETIRDQHRYDLDEATRWERKSSFTLEELKTDIQFISEEVKRRSKIGLLDELLERSNQMLQSSLCKLVTPSIEDISTMDINQPNQTTPVVQVMSVWQWQHTTDVEIFISDGIFWTSAILPSSTTITAPQQNDLIRLNKFSIKNTSFTSREIIVTDAGFVAHLDNDIGQPIHLAVYEQQQTIIQLGQSCKSLQYREEYGKDVLSCNCLFQLHDVTEELTAIVDDVKLRQQVGFWDELVTKSSEMQSSIIQNLLTPSAIRQLSTEDTTQANVLQPIVQITNVEELDDYIYLDISDGINYISAFLPKTPAAIAINMHDVIQLNEYYSYTDLANIIQLSIDSYTSIGHTDNTIGTPLEFNGYTMRNKISTLVSACRPLNLDAKVLESENTNSIFLLNDIFDEVDLIHKEVRRRERDGFWNQLLSASIQMQDSRQHRCPYVMADEPNIPFVIPQPTTILKVIPDDELPFQTNSNINNETEISMQEAEYPSPFQVLQPTMITKNEPNLTNVVEKLQTSPPYSCHQPRDDADFNNKSSYDAVPDVPITQATTTSSTDEAEDTTWHSGTNQEPTYQIIMDKKVNTLHCIPEGVILEVGDTSAADHKDEDIAVTISSINEIVRELETQLENSPVAHVNINVPEEVAPPEHYPTDLASAIESVDKAISDTDNTGSTGANPSTLNVSESPPPVNAICNINMPSSCTTIPMNNNKPPIISPLSLLQLYSMDIDCNNESNFIPIVQVIDIQNGMLNDVVHITISDGSYLISMIISKSSKLSQVHENDLIQLNRFNMRLNIFGDRRLNIESFDLVGRLNEQVGTPVSVVTHMKRQSIRQVVTTCKPLQFRQDFSEPALNQLSDIELECLSKELSAIIVEIQRRKKVRFWSKLVDASFDKQRRIKRLMQFLNKFNSNPPPPKPHWKLVATPNDSHNFVFNHTNKDVIYDIITHNHPMKPTLTKCDLLAVMKLHDIKGWIDCNQPISNNTGTGYVNLDDNNNNNTIPSFQTSLIDCDFNSVMKLHDIRGWINLHSLSPYSTTDCNDGIMKLHDLKGWLKPTSHHETFIIPEIQGITVYWNGVKHAFRGLTSWIFGLLFLFENTITGYWNTMMDLVLFLYELTGSVRMLYYIGSLPIHCTQQCALLSYLSSFF
eukprot:scaffold11976_cov22-Cyclotella_meneghiniana.AAC.1